MRRSLLRRLGHWDESGITLLELLISVAWRDPRGGADARADHQPSRDRGDRCSVHGVPRRSARHYVLRIGRCQHVLERFLDNNLRDMRRPR